MIEIIPAIDLIEGKCVRLTQGDYSQKKIYNEDPLEVVKQFESSGIKRLHMVDLDGAKAGRLINLEILESVASKTNLVIDFGGGIKSEAAIQSVFNAGASIATIGSISVKQPELFYSWIEKFGPDKILLGADVKNNQIAIDGWMNITHLNIFDFLKANFEKGARNVFCTDISKDGLLSGPSVELYKDILTKFPGINLIASGGVSSLSDLYELNKAGCKGVIVGKAIYEGLITINEIRHIMELPAGSSFIKS